jgi:signal transduction histidine kinase
VDDTVTPERHGPPPRARGGVRSGGRTFADRWPFRRKLNILVGVPVVVVLALLAYVISGLVGQAQDAASAARLVRDSRQVAELVDRVDTEHTQAVLLSVRYESATSGARPSLTAYRQAQTSVDSQVTKVRSTFGSHLPSAEAQVLKQINGFSSLRSTIEQSYLPADNIDPAYTSAVDGLIDGLGLDVNGNLSSTTTGNLLDSLLRAEAAHSTFETSVFSAQTGDSNALIEYTNAVGSYQLYTSEAARFGRFSTDQQKTELAGIEQGTTWNTISMQYAGLQIDPSSLETRSPAQVRTLLGRALQSYPSYQRQAQNRLKVTNSLIDQIARHADQASTEAWWRAAYLFGGALLAFVLWLTVTVAIRRSVIRPVQALTGAAAQVAEVAGQELARVADDDAADAGPPRLREVPVTARDEIGDLADAFNRVQTTAAALLERQVLSRRNVAEMFGNVGRRVSNLTARQLTLIDAVERGETDPDLLDRLYRIDHLAVRLQRNADSLMLLAGIRESGVDASPTSLTNVVRAALGQIEGYQRVSMAGDTDVTLAPDIIADLTLMLAELLENAVSFSPARSPVEVSLRTSTEGALISVTDHGLGMSADRLAEENARLIRRERLDLVPTKVLGLFVVGSLARRWGVRVTLNRTPGGGVTAQVGIPSSLLMASPFAAEPNPNPATATATRQSPPQPVGYEPAPVGYDPAPAPEPVPSAYDTAAYEPAPVPAARRASAESFPPVRRAPAGPLPAGPAPARALTAAPGSANPLPRRVPRRQSAPSAPAASPMPAPMPAPARPEPAAPAPRTPSWAAPAAPAEPAYGSPAASYPAPAPDVYVAPAPDPYATGPAGHPGYSAPYEPAPQDQQYGGSYGQDAYGAQSYGQQPYGQEPYPSESYGSDTPEPYGRSYGAESYGRDAYGQDRYDQDQYGSGYGGRGGPSNPAGPGYGGQGQGQSQGYGAPAGPGGYGTPAGPGYGTAPAGPVSAEHTRPAAGGEQPRPASGGAPLRRRVRGATLKATRGDGAPRTAAPRPAVDAEEVRSELDEFEAAIERANRDTRTTRTDEGAQQ